MTASQDGPTANDPVVSAAWLRERLDQLERPQTSDVVVLDATLPPVGVVPAVETRARYRAEHIPGAVFFDIEELSDHTTHLPHMLPDENTFSRKMGALGVADTLTIVVYEQEGVFSAPRAWWMLRTLGAQQVYLLDGGLAAWKEAGYVVEEGEVTRAPAIFRAHRDAAAVCSFAEVNYRLQAQETGNTPEQMVDARPAPRFTGAAPEPRPGIASGHMPGARNVPSSSLTQGGRLLSPAAAREVFLQAGVDLDRPVVTTCGSGVTAAILLLQLERMGVRDLRLYDGSWAEYAQQPEAKIVTGE